MAGPDLPLPCRVKYTRRKGSIAIKVTAGEIRLLAPKGTPQRTLERLLEERAAWIREVVRSRRLEQPPARRFETGDSLLHNGIAYPLRVETGEAAGLEFSAQQFRLRLTAADTPTAGRRALIQRWYQQQAEAAWPQRLDHWAAITGLRPRSLKIRPYKSRWGACTADGEIRLNTQLAMAPEAMLDYVMIHELCHLRHLDHSPAYWTRVEAFCPDWKQKRRWLRENGHRLILD